MTSPTDPSRTPPAAEPDDRRRNALLAAVAVVVVLALVVGGALLLARDDDEVTTGTTTSTVAAGSTSTAAPTSSTTSTTAASTTSTSTSSAPGVVTDEEAATIVWPDPDGDLAYRSGPAAAEGFAVDLAGFTDPVVGELRAGDARSGEVEVRAVASGPVSTVLVRQMGDGNWYVIGAETADIEVDDPIAGTAIDAPLLVAGRALAFEGTVEVAVVERGSTEPLGTGVVTGGGSEMLPFAGEIAWANPGGGWGVVLFRTSSAEDGSVVQVTAIPVGFIGGD
jgi:hypothetical protein